jgi:GT2 family glycosyltransferase
MNEDLAVDFQDVDFCLRLRTELGGELMYDPTYPLTHVQSASRGLEGAGNGYTVARMEFLWGSQLRRSDPHYNPHLSLQHHDFSLGAIPQDVQQKLNRLAPRFESQP